MGGWISRHQFPEPEQLDLDQLINLIKESKYCMALTGAGVSAESGVPTFRDPSDGLWRDHNMMQCATIWGFKRNPAALWALVKHVIIDMDPRPNPSHYGMATLERLGHLKGIITQNVDNFHEEAGSARVIHFHGNLQDVRCVNCKHESRWTREDIKDCKELPPHCRKCDAGYLRPSAVLFGESIPSDAMRDAFKEAARCDLLLVIGTSAQVSPASKIPAAARRNGAKIVEVNIEDTVLTKDHQSDAIIHCRASQMAKVATALERQGGG